jgi:hypothetical protein
MRFGQDVSAAQKLTEADAPDTGYVDIAPPPPPPPQVSYAEDWSNPYVNMPPLVAVSASQPEPSWMDWFKRGQQVTQPALTGLIDIFGRPAGGRAPPPPGIPRREAGMPLAGWVAIGVAGVVVLAVAANSLKRRSVAGYRRKARR